MLAEGFAAPEPRLWRPSSARSDAPSVDDEVIFEEFRCALRSGSGLWTNKRPRANGYQPLSLDLSPRLAVPLPMVRCQTESDGPRTDLRPYIGLTVMVGSDKDVVRIASNAWHINSLVEQYVSGLDAGQVNDPGFTRRLETEMRSRVSQLPGWGASRPEITNVQVRLYASLMGDDPRESEMGVPDDVHP